MDTHRPNGERERQPGLERRMGREARRISGQHRQLDELYALVEERMRAGDAEGAGLAFQRFGDALEAHFSLEDSLYFPALHGMHPELEEPLAHLVREHVVLREQVGTVQSRLDARDLPGADTGLERLIPDLARHEEEEERLLASLQLRPGPPPSGGGPAG